jgi:hypothetical protein
LPACAKKNKNFILDAGSFIIFYICSVNLNSARTFNPLKQEFRVKIVFLNTSPTPQKMLTASTENTNRLFFFMKDPRSRCYGRTAALRLIVQPCDEDD